jgi:hypothetical protein
MVSPAEAASRSPRRFPPNGLLPSAPRGGFVFTRRKRVQNSRRYSSYGGLDTYRQGRRPGKHRRVVVLKTEAAVIHA